MRNHELWLVWMLPRDMLQHEKSRTGNSNPFDLIPLKQHATARIEACWTSVEWSTESSEERSKLENRAGSLTQHLVDGGIAWNQRTMESLILVVESLIHSGKKSWAHAYAWFIQASSQAAPLYTLMMDHRPWLAWMLLHCTLRQEENSNLNIFDTIWHSVRLQRLQHAAKASEAQQRMARKGSKFQGN